MKIYNLALRYYERKHRLYYYLPTYVLQEIYYVRVLLAEELHASRHYSTALISDLYDFITNDAATICLILQGRGKRVTGAA